MCAHARLCCKVDFHVMNSLYQDDRTVVYYSNKTVPENVTEIWKIISMDAFNTLPILKHSII